MSIILLAPPINLIDISKSKSSAPNTLTLVFTNSVTLAITLLILNGSSE